MNEHAAGGRAARRRLEVRLQLAKTEVVATQVSLDGQAMHTQLGGGAKQSFRYMVGFFDLARGRLELAKEELLYLEQTWNRTGPRHSRKHSAAKELSAPNLGLCVD
ncbi:MAG TPA: hypothetical protein VKE27_00990 [Candidatus Dormibacteraeota bacterium]|nr:hypothetical protein [Candidatus Dormibacteraeota bacterium]